MFEDSKRIYELYADSLIKDWRNIDSNELCRKYAEVESNKDLRSAYFSAIILKHWGKLHVGRIARLDFGVYDILVDTIVKALKNRSWENPQSSIYNDPNGPDKAINKIFRSLLINEYVKSNAQKYYVDTIANSLEELVEEAVNVHNESETDKTEDLCLNIDIQEFIKLNFVCKDYFMAILVHSIAYGNCFEKIDNHWRLSIKKLCKVIRHIKPEIFANIYGLDLETTKKAVALFTEISTPKLSEKIEWYLRELRHLGIFSETTNYADRLN